MTAPASPRPATGCGRSSSILKRRKQFSYIAHLHNVAFDRALQLARQEGFDWLLALDADEFAYGCEQRPAWDRPAIAQGSLIDLVERAPREAEMIRLRTRELVPQVLPAGVPFWSSSISRIARSCPGGCSIH